MSALKARFLSHDWFPAPLPDNVVLGEDTWLYSTFAFCHYRSQRPIGLRVGDNTGLYNGTFFDLGCDGEVAIGNCCTLVGAIISTNRRIEIADYVFIAHEVVLADAAAARPGPEEKPYTGPSIRIEENAWIGARAVLLSGAHIGEASIVGAAAVVDFAVPPYTVVAGNPARIVKRIYRRDA